MADDPLVKAYMIRNSNVSGRLLVADTVVELPRSVATELRDRNAARKPTRAEAATFKEVAAKPLFGEEPDEDAEAEASASSRSTKAGAAK